MSNMNRASSQSLPDLGTIFDEHFDYVWATLGRLGVRSAEREDLVQEVFLKVHRRLADYDDARPLRPWLFGFTFRVAADHHRRPHHRLEGLDTQDEPVAEGVPADERIAARQEREIVLRALDTIKLDRRAVLLLHDIDDVPVPDIAKLLDIPLNTAYSRLRVARAQLAAAVTRLRIARGVR
jgi:RNA polymerase sigma-70 factor (ECF subfamily)